MKFRHTDHLRNRTGVSIVEFVGCLAALGGGLAMGLVYLGFDLEAVSSDALEYVDSGYCTLCTTISEKLNDERTEEGAESTEVTDESIDAIPDDQPLVTEATTDEIAAPETELPGSEEIATTENTNEEIALEPIGEETDPGEATQAYWNALVELIRFERIQRKTVTSKSGDWLLFDYLNHRKKNHEEAIEMLDNIDDSNVDRKLLTHGRQIRDWHQSGVKLYGRAVELLSENTTNNLAGPSAQSWQSAATQHMMEEKLVQGKHSLMSGYLNNAYQEQSPFVPAGM